MLLGPLQGADPSEWRTMIEVNCLGLLYCTHYALPLIRDGGGGDVVNVSSVAGRVAALGSGVYNMTKWGVVGFSESLRQEGAHIGVRVTCVEPGFVETELQGHNKNPIVVEQIEKMREATGKVLEAADIANAIVYAVSQPEHVSINEILVRPSAAEALAHRQTSVITYTRVTSAAATRDGAAVGAAGEGAARGDGPLAARPRRAQRRLGADALAGRARRDQPDAGRRRADRRRPRPDPVAAAAPRRARARGRDPRRPSGAGASAGGHRTEELTPPLPGQRADVSLHALEPGAATGARRRPAAARARAPARPPSCSRARSRC